LPSNSNYFDFYSKIASSDDESQTKESKVETVRSSAFSIYQGRGEPDGQQNGHKNSPGNSCNSGYTPSPVVYTKSKSKTAAIVSVHIPANNASNGQ